MATIVIIGDYAHHGNQSTKTTSCGISYDEQSTDDILSAGLTLDQLLIDVLTNNSDLKECSDCNSAR